MAGTALWIASRRLGLARATREEETRLPARRVTTRRAFLAAAAGGLLVACQAPRQDQPLPAPSADPLRLTPQPVPSARGALPGGTSRLPLDNGGTALVHVPPQPTPALVLALHGAGGDAASGLGLLRAQADRLGFVVLAPASAGPTWDAVGGGDDLDTPAVRAALDLVLSRHPVERLAVAGFSDGASYALTLGLANGDLLTRVVAFSPGFENADRRRGRPAFFVTHGTRDTVLPIGRTSRRLVPSLREQGYDVTYREFEGPHVVPSDLADEAVEWALR
jgi:phospholipase/carboxylesterase